MWMGQVGDKPWTASPINAHNHHTITVHSILSLYILFDFVSLYHCTDATFLVLVFAS